MTARLLPLTLEAVGVCEPVTGVGPLRKRITNAALIGQFYAERNREFPLPATVMSVGRAASNTLRIRDERIAAYHISIANDSDCFVLEALSDAVTELNGVRLDPGDRRSLSEGDIITLSHLEFRFTNNRSDGLLGRLWVVRGVHRGKVFRVERPDISIGRAGDNDVQFPDLSVSRHHCRLQRNSNAWKIEDLHSTNGTLVGGVLLKKPVPLRHGDEVITGYSKFVFQESNAPVNVNLEPIPLCN